MNSQELRQYKRDKSKKFNAHLRDLRLKEKKRISDNQPPDKQDNTIDKQPDNLTLQDLMDIFSTLDTKLDLLESKLETKLENNTLLPQFKPIFFA